MLTQIDDIKRESNLRLKFLESIWIDLNLILAEKLILLQWYKLIVIFLQFFVDFNIFSHPVVLRWILNPAWAHWTFQKQAGGKVQKWKITSLSSAVLMGICGKVLTQNTHIWGWKSKIFSYMALLLERSCIFNDAYYWVSKRVLSTNKSSTFADFNSIFIGS